MGAWGIGGWGFREHRFEELAVWGYSLQSYVSV